MRCIDNNNHDANNPPGHWWLDTDKLRLDTDKLRLVTDESKVKRLY